MEIEHARQELQDREKALCEQQEQLVTQRQDLAARMKQQYLAGHLATTSSQSATSTSTPSRTSPTCSTLSGTAYPILSNPGHLHQTPRDDRRLLTQELRPHHRPHRSLLTPLHNPKISRPPPPPTLKALLARQRLLPRYLPPEIITEKLLRNRRSLQEETPIDERGVIGCEGQLCGGEG